MVHSVLVSGVGELLENHFGLCDIDAKLLPEAFLCVFHELRDFLYVLVLDRLCQEFPTDVGLNLENIGGATRGWQLFALVLCLNCSLVFGDFTVFVWWAITFEIAHLI